MVDPGLYEQTVSERLAAELDGAPADLIPSYGKIDKAEAPQILSEYASEVMEQALKQVDGSEEERFQRQVLLTNKVVQLVASELQGNAEVAAELNASQVNAPARQLFSVADTRNSALGLSRETAAKRGLPRPETSIAHSSLFTGAVHEPHLYEELKREILTADRIDLLVSFVMWSGLRLIINELRGFCQRGGTLRVVTTPYMGATDAKAVAELAALPGAQVKITYDTKSTRLHAKSYVFHRNTGFTTAYVGSSNLSHAALSSGLEWNIKIARKDQPETVDKIEATFESYWNSDEFELYDPSQTDRLRHALDAEKHTGKGIDLQDGISYHFDVTPYPFQQRILEKLRAEREVLGYHRNLVVAATGTGKTVISAFDFKRYCARHGGRARVRLLFVAHREEILKQSVGCFRGVLGDANFGDLFVGAHRPTQIDHLFVSIQTLTSRDLTQVVDQDFYDFVIVDEVHHAAASTYERLLQYFRPKVLLGLTATPERADGRSILPWFDNRIAADLRLPEAIDDKLLCPFQYFGVSDTVDLSGLKWSRGGYETSELEDVYVFSHEVAKRRARLIIDAVARYVTDIRDVRGLGFCVSKAHASFMADQFNLAGIPSACLTGDSPKELRESVQNDLVGGTYKFVFVVDIYNEGVDIPEVNTLLFLRPTDSLTVFLQQLGRGLRLCPGKECCTVLDFIGQANKHYRFDQKFAAITGKRRGSMRDEVEGGFSSAPRGCYIQLERKAQEYVLANIQKAIGTRSELVQKLRSYAHDTEKPLTLANFLDLYGLDVHSVYGRGNKPCFTRLKALAGLVADFHDPDEEALAKAFPRLACIDSRRWLRFLLEVLRDEVPNTRMADFNEEQVRMLNMFQVTLWPGSFKEGADPRFATPLDCVRRLHRNPALCDELIELLEYDLDHIDFVDEPVDLGFACPLDLHCRYSRDQLLVAMDYLQPGNVREGVKWLPEHGVDVLMNTLNKAERDYSPTTMYEDYSINEWLFHWQSQNRTTPESAVGQRYIHHERMGTKVALFVREFQTDESGTAPYTFLGLVSYRSHTGSRPMSIIWKLQRPIPAKFLRVSNKLAS
jgi:superfamily II DNA or RNA helicase